MNDLPANSEARGVTTIGKRQTYHLVSCALGVWTSVVYHIVWTFRKTRSYLRRRRQGRKGSTKALDDNLIVVETRFQVVRKVNEVYCKESTDWSVTRIICAIKIHETRAPKLDHSVKVWGGICLKTLIETLIIETGSLTAQRYVTDFLEPICYDLCPNHWQNFHF